LPAEAALGQLNSPNALSVAPGGNEIQSFRSGAVDIVTSRNGLGATIANQGLGQTGRVLFISVGLAIMGEMEKGG